jgi:hypothetical protein
MGTSRCGLGLALVISVAWVGAACGGRTSTTPAPAPPASALPVDTSKPILAPDGPLRGATMAGPLRRGDAVTKWRVGFGPADREVNALIGVGTDARAGADLEVAWYRIDGPNARTHLFSHELKVRSGGGLVFSQGVAKNGLAPGHYETVATVDEHQVRVPWVVRVVAEKTSVVLGAVPLARVRAESGDEDWNVPESGERGWYDEDPPAEPSEPGPCTADSVLASMSPMTDVSASAWYTGQCSDRTLTAAVSGAPVTLSSHPEPDGPLSDLGGRADICTDLAGGSDLPGTVVHLVATGSDGARATETYTLPDFGEYGPVVTIETDPPAGTKVEPGDTITVNAVSVLMPPALGVKALYISAGDELLKSVPNFSGSSEPEPCDLRRYIALIEGYRYEVPNEPPPVITLTAESADFHDRTGEYSSETVSFPTVDGAWTGTIKATNDGQTCAGLENGTVVLNVTDKAVTGQIDASGSYDCEGGVTVPTAGIIRLAGTLENNEFRLHIEALTGVLLPSSNCLIGQPLTIPVNNGSGRASFTYDASSGDEYSCAINIRSAEGAATG